LETLDIAEPDEYFSDERKSSGESSDDSGDESPLDLEVEEDSPEEEGDGSEDEKQSRMEVQTVAKKPKGMPLSRKRKSIKKSAVSKIEQPKLESREECIPLTQEETLYTAKDKSIWTTRPPPKTQTRAYNILREDGGLLCAAKDPTLAPVDIFKLMINPPMVELIAKYTNKYADHVEAGKQAEAKSWNPVCPDEIYAYIGILLYLGLEKKR